MDASEARPHLLRFGAFEANLRTGELRKHGLKVKLAGQPFQVLAMLLDRPGELVTREEIRRKLWEGGTFVDFEHSVNNTVNRLREALGDDPAAPRFVETLPRHGYRFIGRVEIAPLAASFPSKNRRIRNSTSLR
jgi:DNA-binding winged helix-turn-helix (wHTH) protein